MKLTVKAQQDKLFDKYIKCFALIMANSILSCKPYSLKQTSTIKTEWVSKQNYGSIHRPIKYKVST